METLKNPVEMTAKLVEVKVTLFCHPDLDPDTQDKIIDDYNETIEPSLEEHLDEFIESHNDFITYRMETH